MPHSVLCTSSIRFLSTFGCALLAFSAGCTTGQIGGEIEHTEGPGEGDALAGPSCEAIETTDVDVGEETSIGITAEDVIEAISGTHETTLSWAESLSDLDVTVSPEAGDTTITIAVVPRPESATVVDLEPVEPDSGQEEDLAIEEPSAHACADEIRIVADVTVTSGNGALYDTFEVTFRAKNGSVVSGSVEIAPGELEGSFDVITDEGTEPVATRLSLSFAFGTVSGEITGHLQQVQGDPNDPDSSVSESAAVIYGRFPQGGCQSGVFIAEDSPWSDAMRDAVSSNTEFDFSWQDDEPTTLTVAPTVGTLCLEVDNLDGGGTIRGDVSALVESEDGRIDAAWELEVRAEIESDEITSLSVSNQAQGDLGYVAEDFAAHAGISGVETDATDLSFEFVYTIGLDGETTGGTLTVLELVIPDCLRPDYEPEIIETPDGGSGSSGCEGIDFTEIETATFVAVEN